MLARYLAGKKDYVSLKGGNDDTDKSKSMLLTDQIDHPLSKENMTQKPKIQTQPAAKPEIPTIRTILLVTHNARIRCFLEDILPELMSSYRTQKNVDEIRFKNCCVIKLHFVSGSKNATISLEYEGDVQNRKEGAYFTTLGTNKHKDDIVFVPVSFPINKIGINDTTITEDCCVYIVRHGEAEHNLKGSLHLKKDTLITSNSSKDDDGVRQTVRAANALKQILGNTSISYTFCSDLKRTRQTLSIILQVLKLKSTMIVLPCSNELQFTEGGKCDSVKKGFFSIVPAENKEVCSSDPRGDMCSMVDSYPVDWSYYNKFFKIDKMSCSQRTMFQIMFMIISVHNNNSSSK